MLYLHGVLAEGLPEAQAGWEALAPLRCLCFLSVSGNRLTELPAPVAALTQLRALHLEDNALAGLPPTPLWAGLRELVVDWPAALHGAGALAGATALTRLVLTPWRETDGGLDPTADEEEDAVAGEALLGALAALPALRLVQDVFERGVGCFLTPGMAHVMWRLSGRRPGLRLASLPDSNVGWTMSRLVAGLAHNRALAVLAADGIEGLTLQGDAAEEDERQ